MTEFRGSSLLAAERVFHQQPRRYLGDGLLCGPTHGLAIPRREHHPRLNLVVDPRLQPVLAGGIAGLRFVLADRPDQEIPEHVAGEAQVAPVALTEFRLLDCVTFGEWLRGRVSRTLRGRKPILHRS